MSQPTPFFKCRNVRGLASDHVLYVTYDGSAKHMLSRMGWLEGVSEGGLIDDMNAHRSCIAQDGSPPPAWWLKELGYTQWMGEKL